MGFVNKKGFEGTKVPADRSKDHLWIVGGGIAGMAAAAFGIRDTRVPANQIHILEMLDIEGGSLDVRRTMPFDSTHTRGVKVWRRSTLDGTAF